MTVVKRRKPAVVEEPVRRGRRGRPPMASERFRKGQRVQVVEDYNDNRYAEKIGEVVEVLDVTDDVYSRGRVRVQLVWHELNHKLFGGKAPTGVWFKPNDLEKL